MHDLDEFDQEAEAQANGQGAAEEEQAAETQEAEAEGLDDFINEVTYAVPDPSTVIILNAPGGESKYIPATEPLTVDTVISRSGLAIMGEAQFWLNGAQVDRATLVPPGQTLTLVASVKGG